MGYRLTIKGTLQGTYLDFKKRFLIYSVSNIALVDKKNRVVKNPSVYLKPYKNLWYFFKNMYAYLIYATSLKTTQIIALLV